MKPFFISIIAGSILIAALNGAASAHDGRSSAGAMLLAQNKQPDAKKQDDNEFDSGLEKIDGIDSREFDDEKNVNIDKKRGAEADIDVNLKEYASLRKSRKAFKFNVGLSIGAIACGIPGPRYASSEYFRFRYAKDGFNVGFRGGIEALFFIHDRHCLSFGLSYEQRKIQIKIINVPLMYLVFPVAPPPAYLYLPIDRYATTSGIDTHYATPSVAYRYNFLDEFYLGVALDAACLFQAKARYGVITYSTSMDFRKRLQPVDFSGRLLFGFTMNKVFIEISLGTVFFDYDLIKGERHPILLTGMIGYRL